MRTLFASDLLLVPSIDIERKNMPGKQHLRVCCPQAERRDLLLSEPECLAIRDVVPQMQRVELVRIQRAGGGYLKLLISILGYAYNLCIEGVNKIPSKTAYRPAAPARPMAKRPTSVGAGCIRRQNEVFEC